MEVAQEDLIREESMTDLWNVWYSELHQQRAGLTLKVKSVVYSGQSPFQRIDILDTYEFGKMLVLYGSIMITERDEFIYHEMISHPALFTHPNPRRVLVIGGGDGGTVREVLKHPEVEQVTLVEIDQMVVEKCKEYFPQVACQLDNPKTRILFQDGAKFVAETQEKFDVVLVDASDPIGPAEVLFQKKFHQDIYNLLEDGGIMVTQSESPFFHQRTLRRMYENLQGIFPLVKVYWAYVPTYPSGIWSFTLCSKGPDPATDFKAAQYAELGIETNYYNDGIHHAAFVLPNFVRKALGQM
ncbi:MAG: polyamine aminopropyltransferase [Syntrophomonadaceae bacterium]|nr:polyamine aminopropyltransferase [Syntrophomonadaceae bacterium]